LNDFWEFDLESQQWTEVETTFKPPPLHTFAYTSYVDEENNEFFLVYAGITLKSFNDKIYQ
jgi:hypothetical protein